MYFEVSFGQLFGRNQRAGRAFGGTSGAITNSLPFDFIFTRNFLSLIRRENRFTRGCVQMAAIFPILDVYSCIATKWTRHMGFCITYTALLMKTWR